MSICKICKKPVMVGEVVHSACREREVSEIMQTICDEYCKHPVLSADEDEMNEECDRCKLAELLGLQEAGAS